MTESRDVPERRTPPPPVEREGGDAACWAHRVCPECGRLNDAEHPVVCENCGVRFQD
ncbi:MAG: hypothetical protein ABI232_09025 [Jatrophihabitantaceae bacterium]